MIYRILLPKIDRLQRTGATAWGVRVSHVSETLCVSVYRSMRTRYACGWSARGSAISETSQRVAYQSADGREGFLVLN
jgi:hypothetical protein